MTSLAEQLRPLLEEWAQHVGDDAADLMLATAQALAPIGAEGGGETRDSGEVDQAGHLAWSIQFDDRGYTDEGPEPHTILGNPLLAFDWPERGLFPAIFRSVEWKPGPGVAANKGWFSERAMTDDQWQNALTVAAESVEL